MNINDNKQQTNIAYLLQGNGRRQTLLYVTKITVMALLVEHIAFDLSLCGSIPPNFFEK